MIGISYSLSLFDKFPSLDLNIEKNHKRGRRKKCAPALQRNSFGPLNPTLLTDPAPTTSKKRGRPKKIVEDVIPTVEPQQTQQKKEVDQEKMINFDSLYISYFFLNLCTRKISN